MKHDELDPGEPCAAFRTELSALHDGEARASEALARHLSLCAPCTAFAAALGTLGALFDPLRAREPRAELQAALLARAERAVHAGPRSVPARVWALRIAAGLVGFLSVQALARGRGAEPSAPREHALELLVGAGPAFESYSAIDSLPELTLLAHVTHTGEDQR